LKKSKTKRTVSLKELATQVNAEFSGDGATEISGVAPIDSAGPGDITFVANEKYLKFLAATRASAVVLDKDTPCDRLASLRHDNPYLTFARIIDILYPGQPEVNAGIHASAVVEPDSDIAASAGIGPLCHIRGGVTIGENTRLVSSVFVGRDATIGKNCLFYPGVRIMDGTTIGDNAIVHSSTVIGSDGFGFAESETGLKKIKQIGWVEIENDVEIGANVTIDRGALGPTRIGQGTKIDNLVHIAHNVEIGRHCILVAQVGISGSTKIGDGVVMGGQVGLVGHIEIGDGVRVGAQSGVSKSVAAGKTVFGSPARDIMETKRIEAALRRLPELLKRVKKLEKGGSA